MVSVLKQSGSFYKRLILLCLGPEKLLVPYTFAVQNTTWKKSGIEPQDFCNLSGEKVEKM